MIKKTRIKIIVVTMSILVAVFIAVGAIAFTIMSNKPQKYQFEDRFPGGVGPRPGDPEFDDAIEQVEDQLAREWLLWYSLVATAGLAGLFVVTYYLSGWIVKPIAETMEKQKQFISDASHELKTPISIISANADVLEANGVDNKWVKNISAQTERMRILTNDLLLLAKIDEGVATAGEKLNISEIINAVVLPFESVIFEAEKTLITNITDNIYAVGAREEITKAAGILLDNAIKYSDDRGTVKISLTKQNEKPVFEVYNTGGGVAEAERIKIFDRFYRSDFSRTRETGGNGLGLSILKNMADKRGWKLSVNSDGKSFTSFIVQF